MTKLVILTFSEQRRFDAPPTFTSDERALYFTLTHEEMKLTQELRTSTNKVGFVLQMGYFKASAKFFTAEQFRRHDVDYVVNMLGIVTQGVRI